MLLANGDHSEIVAGRPAEQKQLIHASQTAAHKTLSAPEPPFLFVMSWTEKKRGEWDCAHDQMNTCCFIPCGKAPQCHAWQVTATQTAMLVSGGAMSCRSIQSYITHISRGFRLVSHRQLIPFSLVTPPSEINIWQTMQYWFKILQTNLHF
jgi:hypothetical protein